MHTDMITLIITLQTNPVEMWQFFIRINKMVGKLANLIKSYIYNWYTWWGEGLSSLYQEASINIYGTLKVKLKHKSINWFSFYRCPIPGWDVSL